MRPPLSGSLGAAVLALCIALGGATNASEPLAGELTLRTDRVSYQALSTEDESPYGQHAFTLVARFANGMTLPVQLKRCRHEDSLPRYGILAVEAGVDAAYDPSWACPGYDPPAVIVVQPGETRTDSLRITGPNGWDGHTKEPLGTLTGRFRLVYTVQACKGARDCDVLSNEFEVRLGR